jgi:CRP-like cAMP-binding protein
MDLVFRKLELHSALTSDEKSALRATFPITHEFNAGQDVLRIGEPTAFVGALLRGMLCRYKPLGNGQRQTVSLPLPGDIFDLQSFTIDTMDHSVGALTRSTVAIASHSAVEALTEAHPRLAALLWRDTVVEGSVFREWIVNCGRRSAYQRIAHLFCETYVRSNAVGLAKDGTCAFPLTQADLADAVGLSVVHVNRVLQRLRAEKLAVVRAGRLTISNWEGLATAAGFDPAYLHARENLAAPRGFPFAGSVNVGHASKHSAPTGKAGDLLGG